MIDSDDRLCTRDELRRVIKEVTGVDISRGTMNQLCSPSRGEGPPVEGWLGRRPLYSASRGVEWAKGRLQSKPYRVHPQYGPPPDP